MRNEFLIVDTKSDYSRLKTGLDLLLQEDFFLLFGEYSKNISFNNLKVIIDGYVLVRNSFSSQYKGCDQVAIVENLYKKFGEEFTNYIKGIFTIIIVDNNKIKIYTDQLGINKFFYSISASGFCISNNYKLISTVIAPKDLNKEALAVKSLLNREVLGQTLFKDIQYSQPAFKAVITKDTTIISEYWNCTSLLQSSGDVFDIEFFSNLFRENVANNQNALNPLKTAITLTGGKDSRTALAALLNDGIEPVGITYGNAETRDVIYAAKLAKSSKN
jgi:asparagine synthetase B (glutamine-hydrolysing)